MTTRPGGGRAQGVDLQGGDQQHVLFAASALVAGPPAGAVSLATRGAGQALVYPWYTVNGGQGTALTLLNLEEEAKAVKLRVIEAWNSREMLPDKKCDLSHRICTESTGTASQNFE